MKELVFFVGTIFGVVFGIIACRLSRSFLYFFLILLLISTIDFSGGAITFFSQPEYRGTSQGIQIKLTLLCAIVIAIAMWQRPAEYKLKMVPPLTYVYLIYIIIGVISWGLVPTDSVLNPHHYPASNDEHITVFNIGYYPIYELVKIISGCFIFWTIANFFQNGKAVKVSALTISAMLYYLVLASLILRYVYGENRVSVFSTTNIFNCYVGMLGAFVFPFALENKKKLERCFYCGATIAALLCIVLTISRSSLMGFGLACGFVIAANFYVRKITPKKLFMVGCFLFCSLLILLKAFNTLFMRFFYEEDASANLAEREMVYSIAKSMANEHFFGVGWNNFSAYSTYQYITESSDFGVLAHDIWFLTLGELGYIGLFAFMLIWIRYYQILFSLLRRQKVVGSLVLFPTVLGLIGANIVLQLQDLVHFSYREPSIFNLTHIYMGMTVAIYMANKRKELERYEYG